MPIIHLILSSPAIPSPNLPISSGITTTPLHVASEIGRADVGEFKGCSWKPSLEVFYLS